MAARSASRPRANDPASALKRALGDCVSTDPDDRYAASFDGMKLAYAQPEAVVRPTREEQVGILLELANTHQVPVTTRGAGSSLTGAATPSRAGWVLDLTRLNRIRIDADARFAHVQAGAINGKVQAAAARHGLMYPPDPSSRDYCTIGGNIACNAGGLRGAKYGVTRDYVVALRGYLPTGEAVQFGRPLRKWAAGYNLRDLWIGSEGMLGIVTGATLKLVPAPETTWTALAAFPTEREALEAVLDLNQQRRITPAILEFLDVASVSGAERFMGQTLFPKHPGSSLVLIELDGPRHQVEAEKQVVRAWARESALGFRQAKDAEDREQLWAVRRKCSPAMFELGDSKLNQDVTVPLKQMPQLVAFAGKLRKKYQLSVAVFGHAGDGNLHTNIMYHRADDRERAVAHEAVFALMERVVALGGTISGEHGIGLAKSSFLSIQFSDTEIAAMKAIKKALDPANILNPDKLFSPVPVWEQTPEAVKLPWDHR
ncbi:MAG: FAD-binding oxidoreductase [Opitutales bacterium]